MAGRARSVRPTRRPNRSVLVVTEGVQTEKQYVERLNQFIRDGGTTVSVKTVGVGRDPVAVVAKCIEERAIAKKKGVLFDECVCLVDVDDHARLNDALTLAAKNGIHLLISRLKFEIWLFWHVDVSTAARSSKQLDQLMEKHGLFHKAKHLAPKFPIDRVDHAVTVARRADPALAACRVGPDPSTALPLLVSILRGNA